jgi:hypothetical protein
LREVRERMQAWVKAMPELLWMIICQQVMRMRKRVDLPIAEQAGSGELEWRCHSSGIC